MEPKFFWSHIHNIGLKEFYECAFLILSRKSDPQIFDTDIPPPNFYNFSYLCIYTYLLTNDIYGRSPANYFYSIIVWIFWKQYCDKNNACSESSKMSLKNRNSNETSNLFWPHCAVFTGQWGNPDDNFLIVESRGNDDHGK